MSESRPEIRRHKWTKEEIIIVFSTCKVNVNNNDRIRILKSYLPTCSVGSIQYQINRYQKRNEYN